MVSEKETLLDIITQVASNLSDVAGLTEAQATIVADAMVRGIQEKFGGKKIYVHAKERDIKKNAVINDWLDGMSVKDIMRKHDVSKTLVYATISDL